MSDFRHELYERYVTTFKTTLSQLDDHALQRYWRWCSYKYLPLLQDLERDTPVLDLGCGPGYMIALLQREGFSNVAGIDISEEQVALAAERGLTVQAADAFEFLQDKENAYGAIIALDFIEHFSKDELMQLLPDMRRALKPGGKLLLQTPNGRALFPNQIIYDDLTHMTILTVVSLRNLLNLVGFEAITFQETGPIPVGITGRSRVALWALIKLVANTIRRIEANKPQAIWTENLICYCRRPDNS